MKKFKQNITIEQLKELPLDGRNYLAGWHNKPGYFDLLSIGEMIHFLDEHLDDGMSYTKHLLFKTAAGNWQLTGSLNNPHEYKELCDALWDGVKAIVRDIAIKEILESPKKHASYCDISKPWVNECTCSHMEEEK